MTAQSTPYERLVDLGVINANIAHLNSVVTVPRSFQMTGHWGLPSRLFRFPIEIENGKLRLKHPELSSHPYVRHLETLTGQTVEYSPPRYADYSMWHHAVDLAIEGLYDELLATRDYTTDENIVGALEFALRHRNEETAKCLGLKKAREIAKKIGLVEPSDRSTTVKSLPAPSEVKSECGVRYPVNGIRSGNPNHLFALIHGLEDGWFHYVGDHLQWSAAGRDFHAGASYGLLL